MSSPAYCLHRSLLASLSAYHPLPRPPNAYPRFPHHQLAQSAPPPEHLPVSLSPSGPSPTPTHPFTPLATPHGPASTQRLQRCFHLPLPDLAAPPSVLYVPRFALSRRWTAPSGCSRPTLSCSDQSVISITAARDSSRPPATEVATSLPSAALQIRPAPDGTLSMCISHYLS